MPPSTHTLPNGDTFRLRDVVLIGGVTPDGTWSIGLAGGCGMTMAGPTETLRAARDALSLALVDAGWDKPDAFPSLLRTVTGA